MNNKITTYEDLLEEEQRLLKILRAHEELLKTDVAGIRHGLKPVRKAMDVVNKFATRDHTGPLTTVGLEFGIDLLVRRYILARAGWFTKIAIPFLIKNYSSHLISEEKRDILLTKVRGFFQKIRPKPAQPQYEASTGESFQQYQPET